MKQLLICILLFPSFTFAEEKSDDLLSYIICKNKGIVRTIRVARDETAKVCITTYTKDGKDQEVGRAQNKNSCTTISENIRGNLVKAGWDCKEVGQKADLHSANSSN
jgi:hypothetical protein